MKSLFKKSLTLVLVAVLMFLMVSCVHSAGEGTSAVGESTPAAAGEGSSAAALLISAITWRITTNWLLKPRPIAWQEKLLRCTNLIELH